MGAHDCIVPMSTPRPRSVTMASLYAGFGGFLIFVIVLSTLWDWGSVGLQEQVQALLDEQPFNSDNVSVDAALTALRWALTGVLVASIATMVFAAYTWRGHAGSRIGLTILCSLAVLTFIVAPPYGIFPAALAGLCIYLLWNSDARHYFAVINGKEPITLGAQPAVALRKEAQRDHSNPVAQSHPAPPTDATSAGAEPAAEGLPAYDRYQPVATSDSPGQSAKRPGIVTAALLLTLLSSGLVMVFGALTFLVATLMRDTYIETLNEPGMVSDLLRQSEISPEQAVSVVAIAAALWVILSVAGLSAAIYGFSRRPSARVLLIVMSFITVAVSLIFVPLGLLWTIAAVVVLVQLFSRRARAWYGKP